MVKAQITVEFMLSYSLYLALAILMLVALAQSLGKIRAFGPDIVNLMITQKNIDLLSLKLINHCKNSYSSMPLTDIIVIDNVPYANINGKWQRINIIGGASEGECI